MGIGDWAQSPIPNPQSPIPNPHLDLFFCKIKNLKKLKCLILKIFLIIQYHNGYFTKFRLIVIFWKK